MQVLVKEGMKSLPRTIQGTECTSGKGTLPSVLEPLSLVPKALFQQPFRCFIVLAKISSTILNRYGESGHPCLIPDFTGGALSFSSI